MPDTIATETDSTTEPTIPQGTGETGNDLSKSTDAGTGDAAAPKGFDEEFLKRLDAIDPATLPQNFRQKLEAPFKADHTRKTQELSEREKRIVAEKDTAFELARKVLAERQVASGPSSRDIKVKELSELAAAGDANANVQLQDILAEEKVAPIRTQITLQNAVMAAQSVPEVGPYVKQQWNSIIQEIQTSPLLGRLASVDNHAGAQAVMEALGYRAGFNDRGVQLAAAQEKVKALEAKLTAYEKERAAGLPSSTTKAGTTNGRPAAGEQAMDVDSIAFRAWLEAGGSADSFR